MNDRKYFGTDGIRGLVGEGNITPEFVLKLGWAIGKVFSKDKKAKILIGKDTRISGYMFESALEAGLVAAGANVRLLGPMPTPAIAYLTRTFAAQAGIVISASHNAYHDNGIKFFSAQGEKLADEVELEIEAMIDQPMQTCPSFELGKVRRILGARERYIEFCKSSLPYEVRDFSSYKIVIDCAHGATYDIAPDVFEELGAEVISMGVEPNGYNINEKVGSTEPELLQAAVLEHKADFGIAYDGDGDRLIFVDEKGNLLDGDELVYIITKHRKKIANMEGGVVGTLMTNLGLELALKDMGIDFVRAKVGDRFVMSELHQRNWIIGGESSGHILCLDKTTTGDGIISSLQVLHALKDSGGSMSSLAVGLTKFPQIMINVPLNGGIAKEIMVLPEVKACVEHAEKILGEKGRVLLRPSGTEPLIRVMVEGEDAEQVQELAQEMADCIISLC